MDVSAQGMHNSTLYVLSAGGHKVVVQLLLEDTHLLVQGGLYDNALQVASDDGHEGINGFGD